MLAVTLLCLVAQCISTGLPWLASTTDTSEMTLAPGLAQPVVMVGGFAKSGTMAIAATFEQLGFSAAHEYNGGDLNQLVLDWTHGNTSKADLVDWLNNQHAHHPVQVWSHFLVPDILPSILESFPGIRLIVPIRWPIAWAESLYDQAATAAATFASVTKMQLGPEDYNNLPPEEDTSTVRNLLAMVHEHGFPAYSLARMVKYYHAHLKMIIETVPPEQLLLVETERLSDDAVLEQLLRFADPTATHSKQRIANVTERNRHANNKPLGIFRSVDKIYIASLINREVCTPLIDYFATDHLPSWCANGRKHLRARFARREATQILTEIAAWSHFNSTQQRKLTGTGSCATRGGGPCKACSSGCTVCTRAGTCNRNCGAASCDASCQGCGICQGARCSCCGSWGCGGCKPAPTGHPTLAPTAAPTNSSQAPTNSSQHQLPPHSKGLSGGAKAALGVSITLLVIAAVAGYVAWRRNSGAHGQGWLANSLKQPLLKEQGHGKLELQPLQQHQQQHQQHQQHQHQQQGKDYLCEYSCGFGGAYDAVSVHEKNCANRKSEAGGTHAAQIITHLPPPPNPTATPHSHPEPAYDQYTGFPANKAAETQVARFWRGEGQPTGTAARSFQLSYSVLHAGTFGFDRSRYLGGGGSCEVFKGKVYGVDVAVKALNMVQKERDGQEVVALGGQQAQQMRERKKLKLEERQFVAEMQLLMRVSHPNICRLLGVSADGPQRCLVLELCARGALDKILHTSKQRQLGQGQPFVLQLQQRLQVAVAIARALVYLHSLTPPMVHRDVKTPNVLIATAALVNGRGNGTIDMIPFTKVSDFGTVREDIRHKKWSATQAQALTEAGSSALQSDKSITNTFTHTVNLHTHATTDRIIGTLAYMPSEYLNFGHVSTKTDSYAFGIILFELMTGLDGRGARAVLDLQIATVDYESLVDLPEIESHRWSEAQLRALTGVLDKCTKAKPSIRHTVAEVLPSLEMMIG